MYVTTFRTVAGPGTAQRVLKGNTISFPQDIVQVSNALPPSLDTFVDSFKVIFVGSVKPCRQQLKKVLTARRSKVYAALNYLKGHHSLYTNIPIS